MVNNFKELNLDLTRLKDTIEEFWKANNINNGKYCKKTDKGYRVEYTQDDCETIVQFYFCKNGTTTINTKIGKHHDKGEELALYLKDSLVADSRKSISVSIKSIEQENFEQLIEFLEQVENGNSDLPEVSIEFKSENNITKSVKATSKYNDSLVLTHYRTTKKLLIQGKPLYVYSQVSYFLSEYTELNGFLEIVYKGEDSPKNVKVDECAVEIELKTLLPNAYSKLGDGLLKMLRTSYMLKEASIPLPDYSCYVFPALRALEGVMRQLLFNAQFSIENDNSNSFGGIFYKDSRNKYLVTDEFKQAINNNKVCNALECCYDYFVQQRHELFHANDFTDSSRFISTKDQAIQIMEKVVIIIDTAYRQLVY